MDTRSAHKAGRKRVLSVGARSKPRSTVAANATKDQPLRMLPTRWEINACNERETTLTRTIPQATVFGLTRLIAFIIPVSSNRY
jgi:hypothetical protein